MTRPPASPLLATMRRWFFAPAALRPAGDGVGMGLAELLAENNQEVRELKAEIRGLRADLRQFRDGSGGEGV